MLKGGDVLASSELDYHLPSELIATRPAEPRDSSRLMVVSRSDPALVEHRVFRELPAWLRAGDVLVFNTSAVLPARLHGVRARTGGRIEGLYLRALEDGVWLVMLRSGGCLAPGERIGLLGPTDEPTAFALQLVRNEGEGWAALVFEEAPHALGVPASPSHVLARIGATPLPPYILKARRRGAEEVADELDRRWYQTVYADHASAGSVAAPTAGLHFTLPLLEEIHRLGVERADVLLHVGPGTFKPVQADFLEQHVMHEEWCRVPPQAVAAMARARAPTSGDSTSARGRVIAVGTTSVRALESLPRPLGEREHREGLAGPTRLLIAPGFEPAWTQGLVTNFHLPRSTLLALVAAFFPGGAGRVRELYAEAIARRYRFYSYGDAMLILP